LTIFGFGKTGVERREETARVVPRAVSGHVPAYIHGEAFLAGELLGPAANAPGWARR